MERGKPGDGWFPAEKGLFMPLGSKNYDTWVSENTDQKDVVEVTEKILKLIEEEIQKLPNKDPSKIFIGGFSQGATMALNVFMRYTGKKSLGGVVAFNSPLMLTKANILANQKSVQQKTPLFIYGSDKDRIMEPAKMKSTVSFFRSIYSSYFTKYVTSTFEKDGGHWMTSAGKKAVSAWFEK